VFRDKCQLILFYIRSRNVIKLSFKKAEINVDHNPFFRLPEKVELINDAQILHEYYTLDSVVNKYKSR
jgi:hypothetical protein